MDRRVFLESSAAVVAAAVFGKLSPVDPKPFSHFELLKDHDECCLLRCKLCKGEFWVDACTEENLRIFENRLVPECEHCKLHDGYGMPLVPLEWGHQVSHSCSHEWLVTKGDSGDVPSEPFEIFKWAETVIAGYVGSRWAVSKECPPSGSEPAFEIFEHKREVWLSWSNRVPFPHLRGRYIKQFNNRFAYGWGKVMLLKQIHFARYATPVFYSFLPTSETKYVITNRRSKT